MMAYKVCEKLNLIRSIVEQAHYNLFLRDLIEREYDNLFKHFKLGITSFSPLFSGVLTGKYIDSFPEDSRYKTHNELKQYWLDYYF